MNKIITILFVCLSLNSNAQTANAGADKLIYITQGNSVSVGGSSSATSYLWTKIYDVQQVQATYPTDPATITSPTSATTTVTGLVQGTWYYQLAATTGGTTKKDTVIVRVLYSPPPSNAVYLRGLQMANDTVVKYVNDRSDTTQSTSIDGVITGQGYYFFSRGRANDLMIDSSRGKFYSTIEDGYHYQGSTAYARGEVDFSSVYNLDSNKTYMYEWQGYYANDFSYMKANATVGAIMQVHGNNSISPTFGIAALNGIDGGNSSRGTPGVKALYFTDLQGNDVGGFFRIIGLDSMVNTSHTIRMYVREGKSYVGQPAFLRVDIDGKTVYSRDTGQVGNTFQQDYPKLATVYDYNNAFVSPDSLSRGRRFSLVTEGYTIYQITGALVTLSASHTFTNATSPNYNNGSITLSVSGGTTPYTYQWKLNGTNYATTQNLTGLSAGNYSVVITDANSNIVSDSQTISGSATPTSNTLDLFGNIQIKNK